MAQSSGREELAAAVLRGGQLPDPGPGRSRKDVLDDSQRRATAGRALERVMARARRRGELSEDDAETQAYEELAAARAERVRSGPADGPTRTDPPSSPTPEADPGTAGR